MHRAVFVLLGFLMLAAPGAATAQTEAPPPVVQSLRDPETPVRYSRWIGAAAGATLAVVGVNAWTGGALLAPSLGPVVSGALGGSWLGLSALSPLGAQTVFEITSLIAVGVSGGVFGHWVAGR